MSKNLKCFFCEYPNPQDLLTVAIYKCERIRVCKGHLYMIPTKNIVKEQKHPEASQSQLF